MRHTHTALIVFLATLLTSAPALRAQAKKPRAPREENQIVAKVNKSIITRRDVEREILGTLLALEADPVKSREEKMREGQYHFVSKLQEKIGQELTVQLGRQAGIVVPEDYIEQRLLERADEVEGLANLVGVLGERGLDLDDMRRAIEEDEIVREVLLGTTGLKPSEDLDIPPLDTYIGPKQVWKYYQENPGKFTSEQAAKVSMVLIAKAAHRGKAAARAEDARRRALSGESFKTISDQLSDYRVTREAGGKLAGGEWMKPGEMLRPEFEPVVWGLPRGGVSDLVETKSGYFLFHIDDKQEAKVASFAEVQDRVKARLQQRRLQENFGRVQNKLRRDAYIWPESSLGGAR